MKKNIKNQIKTRAEDKSTRRAVIALLLSIVLLISSIMLFADVINTKKSKIESFGTRSLETGNTIAISLRSFQLNKLRMLISSPEQNDTFRSVSTYLNEIRTANKYKAIFLLYQNDDDEILCLCDSRYGANLVASSDYFEPASSISKQQFGSAVINSASNILSGKSGGTYTDLITKSETFGAITSTVVPVYDESGSILCSVLILNDASELTAANGFMKTQKIIGAITLIVGLLIAAVLTFVFIKKKKRLIPYSGEIEFKTDNRLEEETTYHNGNTDNDDDIFDNTNL